MPKAKRKADKAAQTAFFDEDTIPDVAEPAAVTAATDEARAATGNTRTIIDYVSGIPVRATPEEVEAVQVFSKRLVEEFNYPKEFIQTRPQFRVRARPSEEKARSYPCDIAVFSSKSKHEKDAFIIVECKRNNRKDGENQLKTYLKFSDAEIGVWFNGKDHVYLHKVWKNKKPEFTYLPTLPKFGQTIHDIGHFKRKELGVAKNLKSIFRDIRNYLAGNATGITRDQALAIEVTAVLFCKIYDEINTDAEDIPRFRAAHEEPLAKVAGRIKQIFEDVKKEYKDVFQPHEVISLDAGSLRYIVGELQNYSLLKATRDAIGEAFEVFVGPATRGEEGQFFTPRNVVKMMIDVVDPKPGETIIDPACGSGGFLIVALEHVWQKLEVEAKAKGWTEALLEKRKQEAASRCFRGLDKDAFLTKLTKAYMAIIGDGRGGIFCEDSLADPGEWSSAASNAVQLQAFDIVVANPPFGSKIKITGDDKLAQYELARVWQPPKVLGENWTSSTEFRGDQSPQILFIERCIQLLKPKGKLAVVLPESIFGMPVHGYVVQYLYEHFSLRGFVSLPEEVFQPYTHAKTCVVFLEKRRPKTSETIQMSIADWCGHDSRGNPTVRTGVNGDEPLDDIPDIAKQLCIKGIWSV